MRDRYNRRATNSSKPFRYGVVPLGDVTTYQNVVELLSTEILDRRSFNANSTQEGPREWAAALIKLSGELFYMDREEQSEAIDDATTVQEECCSLLDFCLECLEDITEESRQRS